MVDQALPVGPGVYQDTGRVSPVKGIQHEAEGDERQGDAHGPAGGLQGQNDHHTAHEDIVGKGVSDPKRQVIELVGHIQGGGGDRQGQQPIEQRDDAKGRARLA